MSDILSYLEGVVFMMDDVLVQTQEEHDQRLDNVLQRMKEVGMTLNKDKCYFSQNKVKFLGQLIDRDGTMGKCEPFRNSGYRKMWEIFVDS